MIFHSYVKLPEGTSLVGGFKHVLFDQVESVLHHKPGVPATGSGKTLERLRGL